MVTETPISIDEEIRQPAAPWKRSDLATVNETVLRLAALHGRSGVDQLWKARALGAALRCEPMQERSSVKVREARQDDTSALAALTGELGYPTTPEQMAERLSRITRDGDRATFVAEQNGHVVGYAGVWCGHSYGADPPQSRVMALVVRSNARRQGIGRALMDAVESWSRQRNVAVVNLNTGHSRADAHSFYERRGYRSTGRRYAKRL